MKILKLKIHLNEWSIFPLFHKVIKSYKEPDRWGYTSITFLFLTIELQSEEYYNEINS